MTTRDILKCGALAGLILASAAPARADTLDACLRGSDMRARLAACRDVIADPKAVPADKIKALRQRGNLRAEAGQHDLAIADFNKVIAADPKAAGVYQQRGLAHLVQGKNEDALSDLSRAIELDPASDQYLLARGYLHLTANRPQLAIADFNAILKRNPRHAVALNNRGLAYRKAGQLDEAILDYSAAIFENPSYALAYANRGYLFEAKGDKSRAIADFRMALSLDRSLQGATTALGRLGVTDAKQRAEQAVDEGRGIVRVLCSRCHAIGAKDESPNTNAPPLRTLAHRYPLLELHDPLSRGIAAPHANMPEFALTNLDLDRIVAYMNSLAADAK